MATELVVNTNAVFTSDAFDRMFPEEGGDSYPPPGRDFILALGAAFHDVGWQVSQMDATSQDPKRQWWEHSFWFLFLDYGGQSFFVQLEPFQNGDMWRVAFSLQRGCLLSLFGDHRKSLVMPRSLQAAAQSIIENIAKTADVRWLTEEEAIAMVWC